MYVSLARAMLYFRQHHLPQSFIALEFQHLIQFVEEDNDKRNRVSLKQLFDANEISVMEMKAHMNQKEERMEERMGQVEEYMRQMLEQMQRIESSLKR